MVNFTNWSRDKTLYWILGWDHAMDLRVGLRYALHPFFGTRRFNVKYYYYQWKGNHSLSPGKSFWSICCRQAEPCASAARVQMTLVIVRFYTRPRPFKLVYTPLDKPTKWEIKWNAFQLVFLQNCSVIDCLLSGGRKWRHEAFMYRKRLTGGYFKLVRKTGAAWWSCCWAGGALFKR